MYGTVARIGLVVPSSNTVVEPEIGGLLPSGVAAYATRVLWARSADPAAIMAVRPGLGRAGLGRAVDELATLAPAVIGFASMAGSFLNGATDDRETCSVLSVRAGCPVLTASGAVVLALRALGVDRIALVSPYPAPVAERAVGFLAEEGVQTVGSVADVAGAPADVAIAADRPAAQAVLIAGTNRPTVTALAELERRLGKPVLSSNAATAWALLRRAGIATPIPALGRLGSLPAPPA
jgi:maleate cis-trans isomerase